MSLITCCQYLLGWPRFLFSYGCHSRASFGNPWSVIFCTYPYHKNCFVFSTSCIMSSSIFIISLILLFRTLSSLDIPGDLHQMSICTTRNCCLYAVLVAIFPLHIALKVYLAFGFVRYILDWKVIYFASTGQPFLIFGVEETFLFYYCSYVYVCTTANNYFPRVLN